MPAFVMNVRTEHLSDNVKLVCCVGVVAFACACFAYNSVFFVCRVLNSAVPDIVIIVAAAKSESELQTVEVKFEAADVVFFHTGGVVGRIVVVVVIECAFRKGQVAKLECGVFAMLVLDERSVVMDVGGFVAGIGFDFDLCRPLIVKIHLEIDVNGRPVTVGQVLVVVIFPIAVGVEFFVGIELDDRVV